MKTLKIICVDNYGREHVPEVLIADNVSEYWAYRIAEVLNDSVKSDGDEYFKSVPDDHKLWHGIEELV